MGNRHHAEELQVATPSNEAWWEVLGEQAVRLLCHPPAAAAHAQPGILHSWLKGVNQPCLLLLWVQHQHAVIDCRVVAGSRQSFSHGQAGGIQRIQALSTLGREGRQCASINQCVWVEHYSLHAEHGQPGRRLQHGVSTGAKHAPPPTCAACMASMASTGQGYCALLWTVLGRDTT